MMTTHPTARERFAKLNANTSGPRHQGETSREAQDALDEIDRLVAWKFEALAVLAEWEATWEAAGQPGRLGESKATAVRRLVAEVEQ